MTLLLVVSSFDFGDHIRIGSYLIVFQTFVRTHEPEVAHRARQLVRLAGDLFDQECLLVAARTNARRGAKRSPFDPAWRDLETAGRAANSNPPGDDQRGVA